MSSAIRRSGQHTVSPIKAAVLDTPLSVISVDELLATIARPAANTGRVVVFCNVHSVMSARQNADVRHALAQADIAAPDGMPLVWTLRRCGYPLQERVYGPDVMSRTLTEGQDHTLRHYLIGTTNNTLDRLVQQMRSADPNMQIVGRHAPPFRALTHTEESQILAEIRASRANIVWVGLGMPKQELWMQRVRDELPGVTLLGVGAAFDLLSGTVPQAPMWMRQHGLEWLYRLSREPRRLWRRYIVNNPMFVLLILRQLTQSRNIHAHGLNSHSDRFDGT